MQVLTLSNPRHLINALEQLKAANSWIFRGVNCSEYLLQPKVFRSGVIEESKANFPIQHEKQWKWYGESLKKNECVYPIDNPHDWRAKRLFEVTTFGIRYSYNLARFIEEHNFTYDEKTMSMYELRNSNYWVKEETFHYFFSDHFGNSASLSNVNGRFVMKPIVNNTLCAYQNEKIAQHYDGVKVTAPTALLDWTYNPYIALFFTIKDLPPLQAEYLSIYAYQTRNEFSTHPIVITPYLDWVHDSTNERRRRQEGTFSKFKEPVSHYFWYGQWPTIEFYDYYQNPNNCYFYLLKYNFPVRYLDDLETELYKETPANPRPRELLNENYLLIPPS